MNEDEPNNWLTISEAAKLVSKSKMTIWRVIQRVLNDVKDDVKGDVKDIVKVESFKGLGSKKYYIRTNFIKKWFKLSLTDVKDVKDNVKGGVKDNVKDVKGDVKDNVKELERQLWASQFEKLALEEKIENLKTGKGEVINLLKSQIYKNDQELKTKNFFIGSLNKKLDAFLERQRESNLLLAQIQDRVKLLEAPKKKKWF